MKQPGWMGPCEGVVLGETRRQAVATRAAGGCQPSVSCWSCNPLCWLSGRVLCCCLLLPPQGQEVIFFETAMQLGSVRSHAVVECVPVPPKGGGERLSGCRALIGWQSCFWGHVDCLPVPLSGCFWRLAGA